MNQQLIIEILESNERGQVFEIIFKDGDKKRGLLSVPENQEDKNKNRWRLEILFPVTMIKARMIEGNDIRSIDLVEK